MNRIDFEKSVNDWKKNLEKIIIPKQEHIDLKLSLGDGLKFAGDSPRSQYIELINPGMHLSTVLQKLKSLDVVEDPNNYDIYDPKIIADQITRFCELNRENDVIAYRHKESGLIYGTVSQDHKLVYDADVLTLYDNLFENIPHTVTYNHDNYNMKIGIIIDDLEVILQEDNRLKYRMTIGNSMFGVGALFARAGSYEMWCKNGAMGWVSKYHYWEAHRHKKAEVLLQKLSSGITTQLRLAEEYTDKLQEANEINEELFKPKEDVVEVLRSKQFGLLKREAEEVFNKLRLKKDQYSRKVGTDDISNALDVGRCIAEVARDTSNLNRQNDLEVIAGKTMMMQIAK